MYRAGQRGPGQKLRAQLVRTETVLVRESHERHTAPVGSGENGEETLTEWLDGGGRLHLDRFTGGMADVVGVIDHDFVIRYVNWVVPGLAREDVIGGSALDLIPLPDQETASEAFRRVLTTGEPARFEMTFRNATTVMAFVVRVSPIRHEGRVIGALTLNSDVTEERSDRMDRDRFFSLSLDMLIVATPDGVLRRLNPAFSEALGYSRSEIRGRPFIDLVHVDDRESTRASFGKVLAGRPVGDFENRYRRKDGSYRIFSWRGIADPVTGDVYAVARDITAQRTTEAQLRHAQKMEAVGQLAGGIAHDFNNLMQAVLINVEMALARDAVPSNVVEHLREIASAGDRAANLTKQLLLFSRQNPIDPVPTAVDGLIRGLDALLRRLLPENITIELDLASDLPSVSADRGQLEQVVINLCVNARDAMDGGGTLTLRTSVVEIRPEECQTQLWARPGRFLRLSVTDTGAGMKPGVRERAFEPFFTTKSHKSGTGLGLATVYGIVQRHDGLVNVLSEEGQGATFEVYLPEDGRVPGEPRVASRYPSVVGQGTILVAEDEESVRTPIVRFLEKAGYRVLSAENGQKAVELLEEHLSEVELVVLDLVMPVLGGPEAWAKMSSLRPGLGVIFTSGYADEKYRDRLPDAAEVLDKPFRMRDLLSRIHDLKRTTSS